MSRIRAVVTDLDGTLLQESPDTREIGVRDSVYYAMNQLVEADVARLPATGRNFFSRYLRPALTELTFDSYGIFRGGTSIVDIAKGEQIKEWRLDPEIARPIVRQLLDTTEPSIINFGKGHLPPAEVDIDAIDDDCFGIWAEIPEKHRGQFDAIVNAIPEVAYYDNSSSHTPDIAGLHITPRLAHKGTATLHVLGSLGILPEETVVIGDGHNDEPLFAIENVHTRIAVNNITTPQSLIRQADLVVPGVEKGGFYHAMRELGLVDEMPGRSYA